MYKKSGGTADSAKVSFFRISMGRCVRSKIHSYTFDICLCMSTSQQRRLRVHVTLVELS